MTTFSDVLEAPSPNPAPVLAQPPSPLVSGEAAAAYLRCHTRTLAEWRAVGRGPRYVRVGRRAFYRQVDLDNWLDAHVFEHIADESSRAGQAPAQGPR